MTDTITFELNGRKVQATPGETIIEVADREGVYIPRFCYHPSLTVAANCRMCLVDGGGKKPLAACATPVTEGMSIDTKSKKTQSYQKDIMSFLLINHPLDCPICDQGGECGLQDYAMSHGQGTTSYAFEKRAVESENLGPFIDTHMTRCIHCTRCVRFGIEHGGIQELGVMNRGENAAISTYLSQGVSSEISGNMIDLCPVGALTSKPFKYLERSWSLKAAQTLAPHDCVGTSINVHSIQRDHPDASIVRVVPALSETNQWISDRDRFAYDGLNHQRLKHPMVLEDGHWKEVSWQRALDVIYQQLSTIIADHGEDSWGCLAHPSSTMEEFYVLQQWARGLGTPHIDHGLHTPYSSSSYRLPRFNQVNWDSAQHLWVIGGSPRQAQPMVMHRIRQRVSGGAVLTATRFTQEHWHCPVTHDHYVHPNELMTSIKATLSDMDEKTRQNTLVIFSADLEGHPEHQSIKALIHEETEMSYCSLTLGANQNGAAAMMCLPEGNDDLKGKTVHQMLKEPLSAYWLHGVNPLKDCHQGKSYCDLLKDRFVVAVHTHDLSELRQVANVMLPMASFAEQSGTTINYLGDKSQFRAAILPPGEAKTSWKIYCVLADYWSLSGWDYAHIDDVRASMKDILPIQPSEWLSDETLNHASDIQMVVESPGMCIDEVSRQSPACQKTLRTQSKIMIHPKTAKSYQISEEDKVRLTIRNEKITVKVMMSEQMPEHVISGHLSLESMSKSGLGIVHVSRLEVAHDTA
ncbi:MAG: NADH-quinone oxidoreductase subunit NuoG [Candidatus Comchoanobacterales bacterium]